MPPLSRHRKNLIHKSHLLAIRASGRHELVNWPVARTHRKFLPSKASEPHLFSDARQLLGAALGRSLSHDTYSLIDVEFLADVLFNVVENRPYLIAQLEIFF